MFLQRMKVWQRLTLLAGSGMLALIILMALSVSALREMQSDIADMADRTQALRQSQRIIVRAQDVRSQIMLALQHNPANSDVVKLHDHALSRHLEALAKSRQELTESLDTLKKLTASADTETRQRLETLDKTVAHFLSEGIEPALQKLNAERYTEANIALLKQTNPSFDGLRQAAVAVNDRVSISAEQQVKHAIEQSTQNSWLTLIIGLFATCTALLLGILVTRSLVRQLGGEPFAAIGHMHQVATGDLTIRVHNAVEGSLLSELNQLTHGLHGIVRQVHQQATEVDRHAGEIAVAARQVAQASESEADATSSMAAALEQLTVSVNHIADMVKETETLAGQTHSLALAGEHQVQDAAREMQQIARDVRSAWEQVSSLDTSANQISNIARVIKEIASQTNLLALNAAIEAARAGETGRGFAVVADEVRKLAERTTSATGDIDTMISSIQEKTGTIANSMNEMLPQVERGTLSAQQATTSLEQISSAAERILFSTRDSVNATEEQKAASTSIAQRVEQIAQMVDETSSAMKNTSDNAQNTEKLAGNLRQMVEHFKV
ncbi:MAG: chemotaxis protein [Proteobacteria bacterium]|nr:chemotaxis protein [Pseudomonadota bacterium]